MSCCSNHKSQKIGSEVKVDKEKPKGLLGNYLHKIGKNDFEKKKHEEYESCH